MSERRRHPRVDTLITYDVRGEGKGWSENYVNLSEGGLRFKTDRGYSLDARVVIDISHYACSSNPLRTRGLVVRSRESHSLYQTAYEVAVEFEDLAEETRNDLRRIVSNYSSGSAF